MAMVKERAGWLIISAEYCIGANVLAMNLQGQGKNCLEPLKLESPEGVSLCLEFHSGTLTTIAGCSFYNLDVHVERLVTSGLSLEIDVSLVRTVKSSGTTEPAIKKTVTENGLAGSVPFAISSRVIVKVEVYSLTVPRSQAVLKKLNDARVQGHLPDVVLTLRDAEFPAHRAVLAAHSPVFLKMFSGDYKEAKALKKTQSGDLVCEVAIPDVTKEAVELFLTLMYQGQTDDWAGLEVELLEIADYYMVTHVREICEARLMGMDGPTALGLLRNADNPVISSELRVRAVQAVLRGWKQLSITPQWRSLQKTSPVLADAIRAAQQLIEPPTTS